MTRHLVQAYAQAAVRGNRPAQQFGGDLRRDRISAIAHIHPHRIAAGEADADLETAPLPALCQGVLYQVVGRAVELLLRQRSFGANTAVAKFDVLAGASSPPPPSTAVNAYPLSSSSHASATRVAAGVAI